MGLNNELKRGKIYVIISFDYITVKIFHHDIFENTKNSNNGDFFPNLRHLCLEAFRDYHTMIITI